ncbi:glycosyltransferase family 2 protein [Catenisphaera adipataccumulans]|uniref:Glycosyltransferase involved in cell wall biosynthesis n=1 Tax=Catenisphaera adipataccumulans TaxID=700500 RepID=A0A7W8CY26_9FIRM|nr:glycosyltransferase family 2 protein [Catenisphaera adipataccumulans]MBB5183735.1 glycosyltransferase involved in cell wall biosynthesis [Catenisphaera adipataccumulans]
MKPNNENYSVIISVIIPYYNVEFSLVSAAVDSVLNQDFSDYEILIVDDGSLKKFSLSLNMIENKDDRIKVLHKTNGGVSSARNFGINFARGKYITFLDADDELAPNYFNNVSDILIESDFDMILSGVIYIKSKEASLQNTLATHENKMPDDVYILNKFEINKFKSNMIFITNSNYLKDGGYFSRGPISRMIKTELLKKTQFNPYLTIGEDIEWNLRIFNDLTSLCLIKKSLYLYKYRPTSATNQFNPNIVEELEKTLLEIKQNIDLNDNEQFISYSNLLLEFINQICKSYILNDQGFKEKEKIKKVKYHILHEYPWYFLQTVNPKQATDKKQKIKIFLYKNKTIFLALKLKNLFIK